MSRRPGSADDNPDRLYTVTRGRTGQDDSTFDVVTLVIAETDPVPGMQSEHAAILRMCRSPVAVVEIAADLGLPVSVVKILLNDLLEGEQITARHPRSAPMKAQLPDPETLKQVLHALHQL